MAKGAWSSTGFHIQQSPEEGHPTTFYCYRIMFKPIKLATCSQLTLLDLLTLKGESAVLAFQEFLTESLPGCFHQLLNLPELRCAYASPQVRVAFTMASLCLNIWKLLASFSEFTFSWCSLKGRTRRRVPSGTVKLDNKNLVKT